MKAILGILALCPTLMLADVASNYVNFVRQIQADSGVEWDVSVAPSGEMLSPEGVGPAGSHYQLWSIHALTASDFLLDEEFVSAYTPEARIEIETGDPYEMIPRTRCDQPFRVNIHVKGLTMNPKNLPEIPVAASNVHLGHEVFNYPEGEHSLENVADPVGIEMISGYISKNGMLHLDYPATNLTGPDLTKLEGEEVFTVSALADYGVAEAVLDSGTLQVWPIADAEVSGLDPTKEYADVPEVTVTLRDLYPDSTTWVRVYPGPPSTKMPRQDAEDVRTSYVRIEDQVPQERVVVLDDLDGYFVDSGDFTIEVLHETPFGIDILRQVPVKVARTLRVRGTLYSKEE